MSEIQGNEGIDQNGAAIKAACTTIIGDENIELLDKSSNIKLTSLNTSNNTMGDTDRLSNTDTQTDISLNKKEPIASKSQSSQSIMHENQASKNSVNKSTNENDDTTLKTDKEEAANQSRELKSLLALSKEAKLDTNLSRKRKSLGPRKKGKSECRSSTGKVHKIQYPVTAESELEMELPSTEGNKHECKEEESTSGGATPKAAKRKKVSLSDTSGDGVTDEILKKSRKSLSSITNEVTMFKPDKDLFCWRCHKDGVNISCQTCPRSYHHRCLKQTITDPNHWPCPECVSILKAESTQTRSPAMKGMTLEHLCSLLKFAVNRMIQCQGSEPFIHAVNDAEFPDYKKYIIQPMDLTLLEKNIKENLYGSTQAFEADAKWILHNSIIFNSYQSKLTNVAKSIIKICKQEMAEIENCPTCYLNANTKKKTWFVEVCPKPHLLVWAKLRGFPFWPGKAMSCKDGTVDVRFFGAHDRAWVPEKECFLYSPKDPNGFRVKRSDIEQCVEELNVHVQNLKRIYVEFSYPAFKTPLDPDNEIKQLQMFLPRYKSYFNKNKFTKKQSTKDKTEIKQKADAVDETRQEKSNLQKVGTTEDRKDKVYNNEDEAMEGYGTDDETIPEIDTEMRKNLLKNSGNDSSREVEAEEDDTQVPLNIEPDTSGIDDVILTKAAKKSFSVESNSTTKTSGSVPSSKRPSFEESSPISIKIVRRNSETTRESTRILDKINRIDISENMEISLGNDDKGSVSYSDNISSSNSECSSDFSIEIKKKPIQVDVDNAEFTISPASKLKMADKLIKRLSDGDSTSGESSASDCKHSDKIEKAKSNLNISFNRTKNAKHNFKEVVPSDQLDVETEPSSSLIHKHFNDSVSSTNVMLDNDEVEEHLGGTNKEYKEKDTQEPVSESCIEKELPINDSVEPSQNPNQTDSLETTKEISEKQKTPEEVVINFPDEIVHEDLDINDTKQEIGRGDVYRDIIVSHDDEDNISSDETSNDENKPLSVLVKDVDHKTGEVKSDQMVSSPKLKVVLKTLRTEEINLEDRSLKSCKDDTLRSSVAKSKDTLNDVETEKSGKISSEKLSKADHFENLENNSLEKQTTSFNEHSSKIGENEVDMCPTLDTPSKVSQEPTVNQLEEVSKSPTKVNLPPALESEKALEVSNLLSETNDKDESKTSTVELQESHTDVNVLKDVDDDEAMDTLNEVDQNIDKANIINIIHSSLGEPSRTSNESTNIDKESGSSESTKNIPAISAIENKKRKMNHGDNRDSFESQNKMLKLVSIASIMNKANNNQEENQGNSEHNSILKTSLQAKKIVKNSSGHNSPSSSTRSSVHEVVNEDVKSEPESEAELSTVQDLEAKKKYLSALNILEKGEAGAQKPKTHEIRTRSKTEEKRERFRVVDNLTKIIEDVAVNYSAVHEGEVLPPPKKKPPPLISSKPDGCEIYVKSFAKIAPDTPEGNDTISPVVPKQRARKSFPQPNYFKPVLKPISQPNVPQELSKMMTSTPSATSGNESIIKVTAKTTMAITPPVVMPAMATLSPQQTPKVPVPPLQSIEGIRPTNGYLILQPPQQENLLLLPPNQTISYTTTIPSQMLSVTPCLVSAPTHSPIIRQISQTPQIWNPGQNLTAKESNTKEPNVTESQNYIPQGEGGKNIQSSSAVKNTGINGNSNLNNAILEPASISSVVEVSANATPPSPTVIPERQAIEPEAVVENGESDEFGILNSLIPENISRAVSEIIRRPPPKLKPRPPGILSQQFSEGIPSSAGAVTAKINSVAHRLGDYFRGMLIETLDDLGKTNNAEATLASLKLEIESLKHKHSIELSEIEKNMCTILKDIQQSIVEDREKIIEETRAACEVESIKRVEEAKSKQWCANCSKEAQFYCCWNTSYCDYPCQQKHWPNHMSKCTQNVNQATQITPTSAIRPGGQQLILRPANPPTKSGLGRVFSKPIQKVYMNRNITAPKTMRVQTSAGNLLTMMETTPGNYQLMSSNAIVRTSNSLSSIKPSGLISLPSSGNSSINSSLQQKNNTSKQPVRILNHPIPVATVLDEDSD